MVVRSTCKFEVRQSYLVEAVYVGIIIILGASTFLRLDGHESDVKPTEYGGGGDHSLASIDCLTVLNLYRHLRSDG